ncbi:hypothetical protein SAMN04489716_5641 [Actinoplanes derwentensis]|uniref:Uncharacterized protein n=1 Tax=Actinoplanes derwentensis TaxID=113562 RepID=A0A1H2CDN4_9ACTN|nr:hypothetical protein Ade03nite_88590 [Actinoplanes derwentensis]SDT68553.1 hypothetical protein SAMN04489716_5641 [Actinoplanes derwentensis]
MVLGGLLALTAGCAKPAVDEPSVASVDKPAPASPSASASFDPDAPLKHAQCMRAEGMTWFPDPPGPGQPMEIRVPDGVQREEFAAAMEKCRKFAPSGTDKGGPTAADLEKLRLMSKCMRENGVPDFPDPQAGGGLSIGDGLSVKPGDPVFDKAEQACSQYLPGGGTNRAGGGPAVRGN